MFLSPAFSSSGILGMNSFPIISSRVLLKYRQYASLTKIWVPSGLNRQINSVWVSTTFLYRSSLSLSASINPLRRVISRNTTRIEGWPLSKKPVATTSTSITPPSVRRNFSSIVSTAVITLPVVIAPIRSVTVFRYAGWTKSRTFFPTSSDGDDITQKSGSNLVCEGNDAVTVNHDRIERTLQERAVSFLATF